jgi:hypothetical protein
MAASESTIRPPVTLPLCAYCGKVRRPVPYAFVGEYGQLICENHCCPTCGNKLELHKGKSRRGWYWRHAQPLSVRRCAICAEDFRPNIKKPHSDTCSRCSPAARSKRWKLAHLDQVREADLIAAKRRTERVRFAKQFPPDWDEWPIDRRIIGVELLREKHISNEDLGERLDSSRLLRCPHADSWERALSGPKNGSKRAINLISEIRKRLGRPAKLARGRTA